MPVVNPEHLLDQAEKLLKKTGAGAIRQTDLRRAISNAYYAVFHTALIAAADDFAGATKRQSPRYALVYRSIGHNDLKKLCDILANSNPPKKYSLYMPADGFGDDIVAFATALSGLQEQRHVADYDPLAKIRLSDAALAVATSKSAIGRLKNSNRNKRKAFLSLVVFDPR